MAPGAWGAPLLTSSGCRCCKAHWSERATDRQPDAIHEYKVRIAGASTRKGFDSWREVHETGRSEGLLVMNGRMRGDPEGRLTFPKGEAGGSMIDLFIATPRVLQQYATFLRVGNLIELDGWEPTDHRPLTLVLNVTVDDESRCRDGKGRKARVELDIARYQDYAEYFEGGSPTMNALSQVAEDLQRGVCNTTQAVERIGGALYKVLVRAFDTHRPTGMTAGGDTVWWNRECQQTRQRMLESRAQLGPGRAKPPKQLRTEGTIGLTYTASPGTLERASYRPPAGRDPRVQGPDSRGVDTEGFRLVAGSTRNGQYATFLRVGNLIELDGWEPTDHRPLTLVLNVTVDDESRCRDGKGRRARVEFDIARYQDYAEYFEGGSPTMNALSQVAEDLQRGVCNTTQAVERIGGAFYKVLVRAFDAHRPTGMTAVDDESRCRDGKGRRARVEFDIARYQDYAEYFEGGSPTMNALSQVAEDLQRGVCNTTQAVERIGGAFYKVLVRAFDAHRPTGMTAGGDTVWWNRECQQTRQRMLESRAQLGPGRIRMDMEIVHLERRATDLANLLAANTTRHTRRSPLLAALEAKVQAAQQAYEDIALSEKQVDKAFRREFSSRPDLWDDAQKVYRTRSHLLHGSASTGSLGATVPGAAATTAPSPPPGFVTTARLPRKTALELLGKSPEGQALAAALEAPGPGEVSQSQSTTSVPVLSRQGTMNRGALSGRLTALDSLGASAAGAGSPHSEVLLTTPRRPLRDMSHVARPLPRPGSALQAFLQKHLEPQGLKGGAAAAVAAAAVGMVPLDRSSHWTVVREPTIWREQLTHSHPKGTTENTGRTNKKIDNAPPASPLGKPMNSRSAVSWSKSGTSLTYPGSESVSRHPCTCVELLFVVTSVRRHASRALHMARRGSPSSGNNHASTASTIQAIGDLALSLLIKGDEMTQRIQQNQ
ncbi:hypothetical protein VOLCADRAFT_91150 [Volvox carteri f. nagariensis]|uniref:Uncharacterized protein n=1 Tax=Volvox carteri f. nagariensis TaxID=3068 RepID=D8TWB1_VOLCA|nr:uncharacterized protein VOLCADRAFT_91150 [Volvox carteri f. nagariensis]EFJ48445.1 hypothetical protein VOLCADRAFT_91150 [Volvox carteri f. nagariensis]|eukprot:XP_002950699.1 hypothetical protein VOLCADRAFT_91150 [Volvox carteri f. nagariensis]